jgi:hypothetical protein
MFNVEKELVDISRNMALLIVALTNKFGIFGKVCISNSKDDQTKKLRDTEDLENESEKEPEKEKPSCSVITSSQSSSWKPNTLGL